VSIELRCESCGKMLRATRERAGSRAACPACGHELYIPAPEEEIEELPMAPEDTSEREREEALLQERRALDRALAREALNAGEEAPPRRGQQPPARSSRTGATDVREQVLAFLEAMRDSHLDRADNALAVLQSHRAEAKEVIDQLVADQIPPECMVNVPSGVYQGFLRSLRSQL
jgi:uncharacterized Zn finger protein (UPF0148 family)